MMTATMTFETCPMWLGLFLICLGGLVGGLVGAWFAYRPTNK